jgi:hypothetical protein
MSRQPEPTSSDFATWRRLVRETREALSLPGGSCGDLAKAERAAKKAVVLGPMGAHNPFIRLVRLARQYAASTVRQRREQAEGLAEVCDLVEARLDAAKAELAKPRPALRPRADIDG